MLAISINTTWPTACYWKRKKLAKKRSKRSSRPSENNVRVSVSKNLRGIKMRYRTLIKSFSIFLTATFIFSITAFVSGASTTTQPQTQKKAPNAVPAGKFLTDKWTGDLDAMQKRRVIRVLTVFSKTYYFVDKGQPRGIVYEAMKQFEDNFNKKVKAGHLRIHIIFIPVAYDKLLPGLVDGRGDIAAANLTITPARLKTVDFADPVYNNVNEIVLTGPASPKVAAIDDLSGQQVYVRKSSSYYESLIALNDRFKKEGKKEVILKLAPENLEDADLVEMLNAGLIHVVVLDNHIASFWKQIFPKVTLHDDIRLREEGNIGWAIRQNSPLLKKELNSFIAAHGKGTAFGNTILQRYLKSVKFVKNATADAEYKKYENTVAFFKKYSDKYHVDYLLMSAQGYQESRLDQNVKSKVGAVGVMQIMPATGKDMNVGDISQMEPNINAGVKYMRFMEDQYFKDEPMDDFNKLIFAFASYNAGPGRIKQMRKIAADRGLNPNVWFGNVERIAAEKIGRETVTYVSNIYKYYLAYSLLTEEKDEKEKAKQEIKKSNQ
ncbi:MAG: lytic transglycosylase F [Acidobacteria bacterium]|nr:MAG: lytic transglycosylase F [Acidobacteriota bacterium]